VIDHLSTYTVHYDAAVKFYDAALGALGYARVRNMVATWDAEFPNRRMCAWGPDGRPVLWMMEVKVPQGHGHTAFVARDRKAVHEFFEAAMAAGGKDNGGPGPRDQYHPSYYGAFVLDPDGNNIEAVFHGGQS
jgi:catechol 2,3-dioxygenase-like lactoylglutathione lyase family enzyme